MPTSRSNLQRETQTFTTEVVLANEPGVEHIINFTRSELRYDVAVHEAGPLTAFIIAKADDGRIIGSARVELYSDIGPVKLHSVCPPQLRSKFSTLANILSPSRVAYVSSCAVAKNFRGKKGHGVLRAMFLEKLKWAQNRNIRGFIFQSSIRLATIVYSRLGFCPMGSCYEYNGVPSQDGLPQKALVVPQILLLPDHQLLEHVYPRMPEKLQKVGVEVSVEDESSKTIQSHFPLFAANQVPKHKNANILKDLNFSTGVDSVLCDFQQGELSQILRGSIQFDVRYGTTLLLGRDIKHQDWIILIVGELLVKSTSDAYKIAPGQILSKKILVSGSQIVATKDSRIMMLSCSSAKFINDAVAKKDCSVETHQISDDSYNKAILTDKTFNLEVARLQQQAQFCKLKELDTLKAAGLRNGALVADVGCGTGAISIILAQEFSKTRVVGIDTNKSLLEQGHALSKRLGLASRVRFSHSNGEQMTTSWTSNFDFAYARLVLQHTQQPLNIIRDMRRIVRPGGKVCVLDIDDDFVALHPSLEGMSSIMTEVAQLQKEKGGDRCIGRKLFRMFKLIGLVDVKVHFMPVSLHELSPEAYYQVVYSFRKTLLEDFGRLDETRSMMFDDLLKLLKEPTTFATTMAFVVEGTVPVPSSRL